MGCGLQDPTGSGVLMAKRSFKLAISMGISVWGVIDKWSCMELGLFATPNAHDQDLPLALWLRVVKKYGGMRIEIT
jgi:hypothetical protein